MYFCRAIIFSLLNVIAASTIARAENTFHIVEELKVQSLLEAYPNQIAAIDLVKNEIQWRVRNNEVRAETYDLYRGVRTPEELFENPDLQDSFYNVYPLDCRQNAAPAKDFDPGRSRHEGSLGKIWGNTKAKVETKVVDVPWIGNQKISVTTREAVNGRVAQLAQFFASPAAATWKKFVENAAGGFNWRYVAGTKKLSAHSWAIALDINTKYSNYWYWETNPQGDIPYKNQIPCEIVRRFEAQGFIWGGKWYHYDTMHFEYRPELIIFSRKLRETFGEDLPQVAKRAEIRLQ